MLPLSFGLLITGLYSVNNQEVIMNQRISPTPEQTAAAWVEFKQWYANCITAAPKASAEQEGVTFAHIYSWCRHWDIDTAALDAICNKFNIPIEEDKQAVLKPNHSHQINCMVKVLAALDIERLHAPELTTAMGLSSGSYTVTYSYPLSNKVRKQHDLTEKTTVAQLLHLAAKDYKTIYDEEDASLTTTQVVDVQKLPSGAVLHNRNRTDGVHGIWGHVFNDLWFEGITIDGHSKTVVFQIGS